MSLSYDSNPLWQNKRYYYVQWIWCYHWCRFEKISGFRLHAIKSLSQRDGCAETNKQKTAVNKMSHKDIIIQFNAFRVIIAAQFSVLLIFIIISCSFHIFFFCRSSIHFESFRFVSFNFISFFFIYVTDFQINIEDWMSKIIQSDHIIS